MDIKRIILTARRQARLTQTELAERAGTSQPTLSAYESGRKMPSLPVLERLLAAAGARLHVEEDLARNGRALGDALALAAALPVRHEHEIGYPRLPVR